MAEITINGVSGQSLNEYRTEIEGRYQDIDPEWNISPETPDGQQISIWSETLANADEAVVGAYNAVDPNSAVGVQLDRIGLLNDLDRKPATPSTATVQLSGAAGTNVPAGTEIRNEDTDTIWATDVAVELDGSGDGSVNVTCTEDGPEPAAVGSLSIIATPVAGLSSVDNAQAAALGSPEESDRDYRIRRRESVSAIGDNQRDSLEGQIRNLDGVTRARVYENYTGSTDSNGVEPRSIMTIVQGGTVDDIAATMAAGKTPGTPLNKGQGFANEVVENTLTPDGNPLEVTFFRPVLETVFVHVEVEGDFDADDVKQAIVDYSVGELLDDGSGFVREGFDIGDVVSPGRLYTPVNNVLDDDSYATVITIGDSFGTVGSTPIDPGFNGLAVFDTDSIEVVSA